MNLGLGGRGGLDLASVSFSAVSSGKRELWGGEGGLGEIGGEEIDLFDVLREEAGLKSIWLVLLVLGVIVGPDLGGRSSLGISLENGELWGDETGSGEEGGDD